MEDWPLVLAGPVLRHVAPDQVSVWVALSEPRSVHLKLYAGAQFAPVSADPIGSAVVGTISLGPSLHVAVVTAKPLPALHPGTLYSYDLGFAIPGSEYISTHLKSEGLLQDDLAAPKRKLALGYATNRLPSFVTAPAALDALRLVHGSCRKTHGGGADALAWVDELIRGSDTTDRRPHQLFLTGDQIYADEIPVTVLDLLIPLAQKLVGGVEQVPIDPDKSYEFTAATFPPGFRQHLMERKARFTTSEGHSHLVTFGEFAAMYLLSWSNVLWPDAPTKDILPALRTFSAINEDVSRATDTWPLFFDLGEEEHLGGEFQEFLKDLGKSNFELMALGDDKVEDEFTTLKANRTPHAVAVLDRLMASFRSQYGGWLKKDQKVRKSVADFYKGLAEVRRALANVPVYMIMDDHEITDDWNVTAEWQQKVTSSPLGRTVLRNGLASYVVFQAWGNQPDYWKTAAAPGGDTVLNHIRGLSTLLSPAERAPHVDALDTAFGIKSDDHECKLEFHFQVSGPVHKVFALDTRTARHFGSRLSAPALLSDVALHAQLPKEPTKDVMIVIAPSPVLSPAVIEEMVWPALMRLWDTRHAIWGTGRLGYLQWDNEAWAFNPVGFEKLLKKLADWKKPVVILSGDVHYAISAAMEYFQKNRDPVRIAQFTSSGLKNSFPDFAVAMIRGLSVMQEILRFGARMERLAWTELGPQQVALSIPAGGEHERVNPHLRRKLDDTPILVPTHGWPTGTAVVTPPHWSWRFELVYDLRPDADRPEDARPPAPPAEDIEFDLDGYFAAGLRHIEAMDRSTNKRSLHFDSNLGLVRFTQPDGCMQAVHELYSVPSDEPDQAPKVYSEHVVPMTIAGPPPTLP